MTGCEHCGRYESHYGWCPIPWSVPILKKKKTMPRKTYILLKDAPEFYKGAIFQEACDDGNQGFVCLTKNFVKKSAEDVIDLDEEIYGRKIVMKQPDWFMPYTEWVNQLPKGTSEKDAIQVLKQEIDKEKVNVRVKSEK